MVKKELNISLKEYNTICNIFINHKSRYNSYSELAKGVQENSTNPIFQNVLKILSKNGAIEHIETIGRNEVFELDYDKLWDIIANCSIYVLTERVMFKKNIFIRTP